MRVKDPAGMARWRKRRHLTQRQLGYLCQCSQQAIQQIEAGKLKNLTEQLANSLALHLDVPWEDLFEAQEIVRMLRCATAHLPEPGWNCAPGHHVRPTCNGETARTGSPWPRSRTWPGWTLTTPAGSRTSSAVDSWPARAGSTSWPWHVSCGASRAIGRGGGAEVGTVSLIAARTSPPGERAATLVGEPVQ